jgi:hypothetical protein
MLYFEEKDGFFGPNMDAYISNFTNQLGEAANLTKQMGDALLSMEEGARRLNQTFGGSRQRITELKQAIADTQPFIARLGGNIQDTFTTLEEVSTATKRNVIASAEDASKLFATSKVIGESVKEIVKQFDEVGVNFTMIGSEMEKAVNSIQNLGLNVSQIMGDVSTYMNKLNEFNFSRGVDGLAKMAATAAVFKFDMRTTFDIADKALSPEKAIDLASAFQRMGVAVGELTDPFQLMNMSLNDPEGLQKSLSQMTKQFAYFDEQTKTFKINPAGMLQMRELAAQTGIQYETLSKSALAAQNFDRVMSQLGTGGIGMSDDDKMLIANIAKMDSKTGKYMVSMKTESGKDEQIEISRLTSTQITKLLEQQKTAPKTMEEISKDSLDRLEDINANVYAITQKVVYGITSTSDYRNLSENVLKGIGEVTDILFKQTPETGQTREVTENLIQSVKDEMINLTQKGFSGQLTKEDFLRDAESIENKFKNFSTEAAEKAKETLEKMKVALEERFVKQDPTKSTRPPKDRYTQKTSGTMKSEINMGGTVNFKIDAPAGVSKSQLESILNSTEFQQKIYQIIKQIEKDKGLISNKSQ